MNYCTINFNDNKLGLKFGMASFRYLEGKFVEGKAFKGNELNEIGIAHILYSGYYNNCLVKEIEPSYEFADFVDYIEMNLKNDEAMLEVKNAIDIWSQSDFIKQTQQVEEAKKKTSRGKK